MGMNYRTDAAKNLDFTSYTAFCMLITYVALDPLIQIINAIFNLNLKGISMLSVILLTIYILSAFIRKKKFGFGINYFKIAILNLSLIIIIYFISYPVIMRYSGIYIWRENLIRFTSMKDYYFSFLKNNILPTLILFIAGSRIVEFRNVLGIRKIRIAAYLIYIIFSALIYIVKLKTGNGLMGQSIFERHGGVSYLLVGDTLAILSIIILCMLKKIKYKYLVLVNTTYLLYVVASRTSFYFYCIIIIIFLVKEFVLGSIYKKIFIINVVSIVISVAVYSYFQGGSFYSFISENNRMTVLVTDVSLDASYLGRKGQFEEGINDIKEFWLTGRLFREVERTGNSGTYMHNILSYWVEYGLIPFLLLLYQSVIYIYKNFINYFKHPENYIIEMVFFTSMYMIVSILISRSYTYPYIWFTIAASARLNDVIKCENRKGMIEV